LTNRVARGPQTADAVDMNVIKTLDSFGKTNGIISRLITWWAIGEVIFKIASKVFTFLGEKEKEFVTFCVEEGTVEYNALFAMAAVYLDKNLKQNTLFKLDKKKDDSKNLKPAGNCILLFKDENVHIRTADDEVGNQVLSNPYSRVKWLVEIPPSILDPFLDEFDRFLSLEGSTSSGIYRWNRWDWSRVSAMPENRVVILPKGEMERIVNDANRFLDAKDWYLQKGIPWRKGYEFFGLPGTGKTSMAICLAMNLGKSLYCVSSRESAGSTFESALRNLPRGAIVLIEDIDCLFDPHITSREGGGNACTNQSEDPTGPDDGNDQMTLSDFLNAIDGVTSQKDGRILIITTNHHDKLDPAITRPGRIDAKVEFKHADLYQLNLLSQRMLGEKDGIAYFKKHFKNRKIPITMAEAENILLPIALAQIENR